MSAAELDVSAFDRHPDGVLSLVRAAEGAGPGPWICRHANAMARVLLGRSRPEGLAVTELFGGHDGMADLLAGLDAAGPQQTGWRVRLVAPSSGRPAACAAFMVTGLAHDAARTLLFLAPEGNPREDTDGTWPGLAPQSMAWRLRKSERRFQQFMDNCPASAYVKDLHGRYLWVNARVARFGSAPAREWVGRSDEDLFGPEEAARLRANDLLVVHRRAATSFIETVSCGAVRQTCVSYKFPMLDEDGACTGVGGMSIDITGQAQTSDAVERLHAELGVKVAEMQTLLDTIPVAIYRAHDPEGRIVTANKAAGHMLAGSAGKAWRIFDDGRELSPDEMPVRVAARGQEIRGHEYEVVFADGARRTIFGNASPLAAADGASRGSVAAFLDITELKASEAELEHRSRRLQLLWETAGILLEFQEPGRMLDHLFAKVGPELAADICYSYLLEPDGRTLRMVAARGMPASAVEALGQVRLTSAGEPIEAGEEGVAEVLALTAPAVEAMQAEGVLASLAIPLLADGCVIGVLAFGTRSRAAFAEDDNGFIRTIAGYVAVAYERIRLVGRLREADRRKDDFLATLAHELRNPLAPIRNAVHILKVNGPPDPQLVWGRSVIERQVHQMTRLLEDLLDVSRISRDKLELRRERVELASVVETAIETSRPWIDAGRHQLAVHLAEPPLVVDGDPVRLAQIFSNLLTNAAKYTPEGGEIALEMRREGGQVVANVRDNGMGIAPGMLGRVFDMFSQAQPALQRAQGGLGIGLSLVKGLVELHGGSVGVASAGPGRGSTFSVRLPLSPPAALPAASVPVPEAQALRHRVLVVDDNVDNAESLAALLEILGCDVCTAYHGEAALEAAAGFHPTVVMLDIGMPGMNGFEVCRRLRAQPEARGVLIVAMTGWGQAEDRARTREAGFDHHLVKPVDTAELAALLSQVNAS